MIRVAYTLRRRSWPLSGAGGVRGVVGENKERQFKRAAANKQ